MEVGHCDVVAFILVEVLGKKTFVTIKDVHLVG
jgi:hypothetical protein